MRARALGLSIFILVWGSGCGGNSESDGSTGGAGGSTGGSGGSTGGSGGSTGGSGGSTGGSGGSTSCSEYRDLPSKSSTTITFENATTATIYVTAELNCNPGPPFAVTDANGQSVAVSTFTCGNNCQQLQDSEPLGCPAICANPPVIRIDAGGTFAYGWTPSVLETAAMPKECYFDAQYAQPSCQRVVEIAGGAYTFAAQAGTECTDCVCTPSASGSCEAPYGTVGGQTLKATAATTLPTGAVQITFK